ncbi:alpha-L-rhamnosidase N-terminal domain-containing protein [Victivallis lenta]|uniref:alpha-L-rhamnosidase-related protein n=1 Tax=Victivallis lenta TaxID=2606640 RepID=UPI0015AABF6B|nr:alpha-L-rhamnosidase N-terminal domain-containing protein [Victivallis lenta]
MNITASWIWPADSDGRGFNLCSVFRRDFRLESVPASARILITADSYYRLKINGQWIGDGPARAYPEHYQYDIYDISCYLRPGLNLVEATVRYYGCGTFHQIPQRGGFLAQIELTGPGQTIVTDGSWLAARMPQWVENTVKSSIQQAPLEIVDASVAAGFDWKPAAVICCAEEGPWRGLHPRDVKPLSRRECLFRRYVGGHRVAKEPLVVAIPADRLLFPGDTTVNHCNSFPVLIAFTVESPQSQMVHLGLENVKVSVNGRSALNGEVSLKAGSNLLVAAPAQLTGHRPNYEIAFPADAGVSVRNFYNGGEGVAIVEFPELAGLAEDIPYVWANAPAAERGAAFSRIVNAALALRTVEEFLGQYPAARLLDRAELALDPHCAFQWREPFPLESGDVENPEALIYTDGDCTTVNPAPGYDIELCYDLGEQNVGFWNFALFAPAGTVLDIAALEYMTPDGRLQHTGSNYRNLMRYICREGYNRYSSMRRRSGRYLFLTVRNAAGPVRIQLARLVESTYPVVREGEFNASDCRLNRIYEISARTMKLCMEDTFTDCPLYEQTLWVGDARNEGLFAMSVFGAYDLVRRCIRLAGQSLERFPLVGCQVPSGWSSIIPIWSFMWGISVQEYCYETGDLAFGREVWPMVCKNLEGARSMIDPETGLLRTLAWNLFDWSKTNCDHPVLLQNSMFLVGALTAAIELGESLGEPVEAFRGQREELKRAINAQWDARKLAWPDSIHADGTVSEDASMHTSMLALLYDAANPEHVAAARANTVTPRAELIRVASPFAALYLYEAFEKIGMADEILKTIYRDYLPMLRLGSTTVWETFPAALNTGEFPTRSHCHGWSAAPLYFLPRLVLGILPAAPGAMKFRISPRITGLEFASGARPTIHGRVEAGWERKGNELFITARAPAGVELEYLENDTHTDLQVYFNGKPV